MSVAVVQVSAVAGRVSRGRRHGGLRREILTGLLRSAVPGRRRVRKTTPVNTVDVIITKLTSFANAKR